MKILAISPTPTHPQNAGNRARIFNLLHAIKEMGHEVFFLHVQAEPGDMKAMQEYWQDRFTSLPYSPAPPFFHRLKRILVSLKTSHPNFRYIDDQYDSHIDREVRALHQREHFDAVLAEYVFFSKALENFGPDVIKIIDTHDIFTDRYKIYEQAGMKPQWVSTSAREELKGLNRAEIILAINDNDKRYFQTLCKRHVMTIGYLAPLQRPMLDMTVKNRILFIGSENPINIQAVKYFLHSVFPQVRAKIPDTKLYLAGKVSYGFNNVDGCVTVGEFNSLDEAYVLSDIVINPALVGTGLSIKAIEALGYAKALVSTRVGIRGIEDGEGRAFLVADSPESFAKHVTSLLTDMNCVGALSKAAYSYARKWNEMNLQELLSLFQ